MSPDLPPLRCLHSFGTLMTLNGFQLSIPMEWSEDMPLLKGGWSYMFSHACTCTPGMNNRFGHVFLCI